MDFAPDELKHKPPVANDGLPLDPSSCRTAPKLELQLKLVTRVEIHIQLESLTRQGLPAGAAGLWKELIRMRIAREKSLNRTEDF